MSMASLAHINDWLFASFPGCGRLMTCRKRTSGRAAECVTARSRPGSGRMLVIFALLASAAPASDWRLSDEEIERLSEGDVLVYAEIHTHPTRGNARAAVKIDAPAEHVFRTMTDCAQALKFVPHLEACKVLETAPDGSWQLIEHVVDYGWFLPSRRYVFRAQYTPFERIQFTLVRGDFSDSESVWQLVPAGEGDGTIVKYRMAATPRSYVPRWLLEAILRRDLPALMTRLRERCETAGSGSGSP